MRFGPLLALVVAATACADKSGDSGTASDTGGGLASDTTDTDPPDADTCRHCDYVRLCRFDVERYEAEEES